MGRHSGYKPLPVGIRQACGRLIIRWNKRDCGQALTLITGTHAPFAWPEESPCPCLNACQEAACGASVTSPQAIEVIDVHVRISAELNDLLPQAKAGAWRPPLLVHPLRNPLDAAIELFRHPAG